VWSVKTGRLLEVLHCTDACVTAGCDAQAAEPSDRKGPPWRCTVSKLLLLGCPDAQVLNPTGAVGARGPGSGPGVQPNQLPAGLRVLGPHAAHLGRVCRQRSADAWISTLIASCAQQQLNMSCAATGNKGMKGAALLQAASRYCRTRTMCWRSPSVQTASSWPAPRWTASCTCGTRWRASCRYCCRCLGSLCSRCCVGILLVGRSVLALVACPGTGLG
jgi:hypothetical protein